MISTPNGGSHGADGALDGRHERPIRRTKTLRIVIADDHPAYRQGLARLLERFGIEVVAQVGNGLAALAAVEDAAPDVVVVDLNMPGLTSADVTRRLTERTPPSKVLVVSVSAQEDDVTEAILAGASGYVLKDGPAEEVVAGIQAAAVGESLLSPRIAEMLLRKIRDRRTAEPQPPLTLLSARELEVLQLASQGKGNREIAEALFIGQTTVRSHISSILVKLQVENRVQAAVQAVHKGLV